MAVIGRIILLLFGFFSFSATAGMNRNLLRSPEALAMGGAYTAFVDDRDAAFYNPAGVAAYDRLSLHLVTIDPTISDWVLSGWKTLSELESPTGSDLNRLMGKNIFVEGTVSTAVLAPGFALIGFYDTQAALYAKNQAFPHIEYGFQSTSGVQAAFGFSVSDGKKRGRGKKNADYLNEWRFGFGAKFLTRTGGYRLMTTTELLSVANTSLNDYTGGQGSGYGGDLGVQRVQRINPKLTAFWGAAFLNIGDITFGNGASPQRGDLSTGLALKYSEAFTSFTLAYDLQQMNRSDDFTKKQNLGLKWSLPLLDIMGGIHQGYFTYGAAFDLWLLRVSGTVYREELGPYQQSDPEDRFALRIALKMDL